MVCRIRLHCIDIGNGLEYSSLSLLDVEAMASLQVRLLTLGFRTIHLRITVSFALFPGIFELSKDPRHDHATRGLVFADVADFFARIRIVCCHSTTTVGCLEGAADPLFRVGKHRKGIVGSRSAIAGRIGWRIVHAPLVTGRTATDAAIAVCRDSKGSGTSSEGRAAKRESHHCHCWEEGKEPEEGQ